MYSKDNKNNQTDNYKFIKKENPNIICLNKGFSFNANLSFYGIRVLKSMVSNQNKSFHF